MVFHIQLPTWWFSAQQQVSPEGSDSHYRYGIATFSSHLIIKPWYSVFMADKFSSYVATVSPLVDEGITHKASYLQWNFMLHCVSILPMQQPIIIPKHMYTLYHPPALSVPRQKIIICTIVSCMRSSLYRSLQTLALTKTDYSGTWWICAFGTSEGGLKVAEDLQDVLGVILSTLRLLWRDTNNIQTNIIFVTSSVSLVG